MIQPSLIDPFQQSRLIRLFEEFEVANSGYCHERFGAKIADWINLSDSFSLADDLYRIQKAGTISEKQNVDVNSTPYTDRIVEIHTHLTKRLIDSFDPSKNRTLINRLEAADKQSFDLYRRHYIAQQREMEVNINQCRALAREALSKGAPNNIQLSLLDESVIRIFDSVQRRTLAKIPGLISKIYDRFIAEFESTFGDTTQWFLEDAGNKKFLETMRAISLAECEHRFQPLVGLLDVMDSKL